MGYHSEWVEIYFKNIINNNSMPVQTSEIFFRAFIPESLNEILTGFYSFKYSKEILDGFNSSSVLNDSKEPNDFREKMRRSIYISNNTHSKKTLLKIFSERPDPELLKEAILHFEKTAEIFHYGIIICLFQIFWQKSTQKYVLFIASTTCRFNQNLIRLTSYAFGPGQPRNVTKQKKIIQYTADKWLNCL